jgi:hypothetical protein
MKQIINAPKFNDQTNGRMKGIAYLLLSIMIVMFFVFVLAPGIDNVPHVKPLINFIDEYEINAAALYYTDIDEFSVAEINIKNTLDYSPCFTSDKKALTIPSSSKLK